MLSAQRDSLVKYESSKVILGTMSGVLGWERDSDEGVTPFMRKLQHLPVACFRDIKFSSAKEFSYACKGTSIEKFNQRKRFVDNQMISRYVCVITKYLT